MLYPNETIIFGAVYATGRNNRSYASVWSGAASGRSLVYRNSMSSTVSSTEACYPGTPQAHWALLRSQWQPRWLSSSQAAAVWKKAHKPGKPQWQWRCLSSPKHQSLTAVSPDGELGADDTTTIAREVAHCSAKVSAKKTHVILDFRPTLSGRLF